MLELTELVDRPVERLHVEYKSWLDIGSSAAVRADVARHIAAIANFGGGHLVFGIDDEGVSCGPAPADFRIDRDIVASITKRYLDPSVHCDVYQVTSSEGVVHPIVSIPSHGAVPICAKSSGPETNGKPQGIVAGSYYLRKPGPESAPIVSAAEWRDVIRRCAVHDRTAILSAIAAAIAVGAADAPANGERALDKWAEAADVEYVKLIGDRTFVAPLKECRISLSYSIVGEKPVALPPRGFLDIVRRTAYDVDAHVRSGWSLFYVFDAEGMAPHYMSDPALGDDDFLQCSLLDPTRSLGFDLWRISRAGFATQIREFWEDTPDFGSPPRTSLDPQILLQTLAELIRHALALAMHFPAPSTIRFRCEWTGLLGRRLKSSLGIPSARAAQANRVVSKTTLPIAVTDRDIARTIADLAGGTARVLGWEDLEMEDILSQMPRWKR